MVLVGSSRPRPLQCWPLLCRRSKETRRSILLNPHPHSSSHPAPPNYGKVDLVPYDDSEYLRWSEGFAFRRRRERQREGKVRIEPAALSIISFAAEFGVRSILSFRELDAVAFTGDKATAVFEFKLSGLGSASAVSRAAKQLRSAAEMIRQGYGHTPKIAVVLIHAGEGHPDLGKPGGRYGVRPIPLEKIRLDHLPEQPIPCFVFSMKEAIEEARRIGHQVDHELERRAAREGKHGLHSAKPRRLRLPRLPIGELLTAISWMTRSLIQAVGHVTRKVTRRRTSSHHAPYRRRPRGGRNRRR